MHQQFTPEMSTAMVLLDHLMMHKGCQTLWRKDGGSVDRLSRVRRKQSERSPGYRAYKEKNRRVTETTEKTD